METKEKLMASRVGFRSHIHIHVCLRYTLSQLLFVFSVLVSVEFLITLYFSYFYVHCARKFAAAVSLLWFRHLLVGFLGSLPSLVFLFSSVLSSGTYSAPFYQDKSYLFIFFSSFCDWFFAGSFLSVCSTRGIERESAGPFGCLAVLICSIGGGCGVGPYSIVYAGGRATVQLLGAPLSPHVFHVFGGVCRLRCCALRYFHVCLAPRGAGSLRGCLRIGRKRFLHALRTPATFSIKK